VFAHDLRGLQAGEIRIERDYFNGRPRKANDGAKDSDTTSYIEEKTTGIVRCPFRRRLDRLGLVGLPIVARPLGGYPYESVSTDSDLNALAARVEKPLVGKANRVPKGVPLLKDGKMPNPLR
jgi:hypothetical protein